MTALRFLRQFLPVTFVELCIWTVILAVLAGIVVPQRAHVAARDAAAVTVTVEPDTRPVCRESRGPTDIIAASFWTACRPRVSP